MKPAIAILLILLMMGNLTGCVTGANCTGATALSGHSTPPHESGSIQKTDSTVPFTALSAPVGHFPDGDPIYKSPLNADHVISDGVPALYCMTSLSQMQDFIVTYFPVATLQYPSPLDPFLQVMTEEFFQNNILLLMYQPTDGTASRYSISEIICKHETVHITVFHTHDPKGDSIQAGILLGAVIDRKYGAAEFQYVVSLDRKSTG